MKKSKFSEVQIVKIMLQHTNGESISDICRAHWISPGSFYSWKDKYSGMEVSHLKQMKDMERELSQYEKIVAELTLQKTVLKYIIEKNVTPAEKIELVDYSRETYNLSLRQACMLFCISTSVLYTILKKATTGK